VVELHFGHRESCGTFCLDFALIIIGPDLGDVSRTGLLDKWDKPLDEGNVAMMIKPVLEVVRAFKSRPFASRDLAKRLSYASGYVTNFLSQVTRQGLLLAESKAGKREKSFRANPAVVREIVRGGGKDKEELLDAIGLAQSTLGSRSLWKDSRSLTMMRISIGWGERVFSNKEGLGKIVVTNVGLPKKIITVEV